MMSRSFSSDCRDLRREMGHTLWLSCATGVVLFFIFPVALLLQFSESINELPLNQWQLNSLQAKINAIFSVKALSPVILIVAVLAAVAAFSHLFSKQKSDFYYALPMKRSRGFLIQYTAGVLNFMLPFLLAVLTGTLAVVCSDFASLLDPWVVVRFCLLTLFYFLCTYTLVVLACVLCGNRFIAMMGAAVFFGIVPLLYLLQETCMSYFFETYLQGRNSSRLAILFSPVAAMFLNDSERGGHLLANGAVLLAAFLSALVLYRLRPAEGAGKAIAFPKIVPFMKYPLLFIITLLGGVVFATITTYDQLGWMIFGLLCGALLGSCVLEILFAFDFRAAFKRIKGFFVFSGIICVLFVCCAFDVFGYDSYLPKAENVDGAGIMLSMQGYQDGSLFVWGDGEERTMMTEEDSIAKVLEFAKAGIESQGNREVLLKGEGGRLRYFEVSYRMTSGRQVLRQYYISQAQAETLLSELYETSGFPAYTSPLFTRDLSEYQILPATVNTINGIANSLYAEEADRVPQAEIVTRTYLPAEAVPGLVSALKEDILAFPFEAFYEELPQRMLAFHNAEGKNFNVPVYPSYEKTLALLSAAGVGEVPYPSLDEVASIQIHYDEEAAYAELPAASAISEVTGSFVVEEKAVTTEDPAIIEQAIEAGLWIDGTELNSLFRQDKVYITITYVESYEDDYMLKYGSLLVFPEGKVPEALLAELEAAK